jgi:hypothetical protein
MYFSLDAAVEANAPSMPELAELPMYSNPDSVTDLLLTVNPTRLNGVPLLSGKGW